MFIRRFHEPCCALVLVLAGCAGDDSEPTERAPGKQEFSLCTKGELESDLATGLELSGPGVNPSTGSILPGDYHVATTYFALQPGKADVALDLSGPVIESLFEMPGFVAVTTGASTSCNTLRTLTVWENEAAMFAFVASPAHARAMTQTSTLSRGTSNTVAWDGSADSVSWQEAARRLGLVVGGEI